MSSQQSSFRDMFEYPQQGADQRHRKYTGKGSRNRKTGADSNRPLKQSFYDIVQKAKHVAMFTQTLKQKIAEKRTLNEHTLKENQLDFLENDSQVETTNIYFGHHNKLVLAFQIIYILTIFIYLWNCTFEIVFGALISQPVIQFIAFFTYLAHIVLFNFTEYKNEKFEIISNRNEVNSIYVKQKLVKDCIFLLMIIIQLTPLDDDHSLAQLYIIIRVISLICYLQLIQTWEKIEDLLSVSNQAQTFLAMFKLLYKIVLFLHCLTIALNILAIIQAKNDIQFTWITQNGIEFNSNFEKYVVGWYWGATILSTVGFGEITPKNNYERFFISIVQVICCMSFGYFVNVIGSLIKLQSQSQEKYEKQVRSLNRCLNFLSIANDLKHKIRTYFFNRHVIQKIYDPNEQKQMLENLAPNLQHALLQENNINVLKKSQIMQRFKMETLIKFTQLLKKTILAPENIIFSRFIKDRKLWFIEKGVIEQFTDSFQNSKLRKLISFYNENDSIVGWINFLTQSVYKTIAKAKIFTIAYELEEQSFMKAIKEDNREYHRLLHMRQMIVQKNRKYVHKCISCDRYTHNVINCPRIHFVRRDIKKLAHQYRHLKRYIDEQIKIKKVDRNLLRYDWKARFSISQPEKQPSMVINNETGKTENATIQNFLKNMMFRQSVIGFEKRKRSIMLTKKQSRFSNNVITEPKQQKEETEIKSNFSSDEIIEQQQQTLFQKVFICEEEVKDFMPDHDIAKVLLAYSNKYTKKMQLQDKVRKFIKK